MSTKSALLVVCCIALIVVVGSAFTAPGQSSAKAQILPGGRPAKIHSYYAEGTDNITIIPSVPGTNGFIITDIIANHSATGTDNSGWLKQGTEQIAHVEIPRIYATMTTRTAPNSYHFASGIRLSPGTALVLDVADPASVRITVMGYEF